MVHNISEGQRSRRKRSKKPSYSASCEELANNTKVQVREQATYPPNSVPVLPDGFEEGLYQLLANEMAYHPSTDNLFNINAVCEAKVDAALRDEATFNLRFLHKFHNLTPECFAHAVNMTDRFLARVKVKPKYMACLATAAYLIAAKMIEQRESWPSPDKLVRMARCGGSPGDLERMEAIIQAKLRPAGGCLEAAVTPLHFLTLLRPLFQSERAYERAVGHLETCLCSVAMYRYRPAQLALCVARRYLGGPGVAAALNRVAQLMGLGVSDLAQCDSAVEAEGLRQRGGHRCRRRRLSLPAAAACWPGLRRLRCRRQQLTPTPPQPAAGLDTISEEQLLDDDCMLLDISMLFY